MRVLWAVGNLSELMNFRDTMKVANRNMTIVKKTSRIRSTTLPAVSFFGFAVSVFTAFCRFTCDAWFLTA